LRPEPDLTIANAEGADEGKADGGNDAPIHDGENERQFDTRCVNEEEVKDGVESTADAKNGNGPVDPFSDIVIVGKGRCRRQGPDQEAKGGDFEEGLAGEE
jgi:hypothetical protein